MRHDVRCLLQFHRDGVCLERTNPNGEPGLFDKSIRRTTNPFEVESKVKNLTFISTCILFLLFARLRVLPFFGGSLLWPCPWSFDPLTGQAKS
jgi:hypothetical protein